MRQVPINILHERLSYDRDSGVLRWKNSTRWTKAGSIAGTRCNGYIKISICGIIIPAHRIAWAMCFGEWPTKEIDHINGKRDDNSIINLREVSRQDNCKNRGKATNNQSGFPGVSWHKQAQKWQAHISVAGKNIYLGLFEDKEKAFEACKNAAKKAYGVFYRHC